MTYIKIFDKPKTTVAYLSTIFQNCLYIPSSQAEQIVFLLKKNGEISLFIGQPKKLLTDFSDSLNSYHIENEVIG